MKKLLICALTLSSLFLIACNDPPFPEKPQLNIDWAKIQANVKKENLAPYGWYAESKEVIQDEIEDIGTISFYNYDPTVYKAFEKVEYQFSIEYGCIYQWYPETETYEYYNEPMYEIMFVENVDTFSSCGSGGYYSAIFTEDFALVYEEGTWFLDEKQDVYIPYCLESCKAIIEG